MKKVELFFEKILWNSRFLVLIAVVSSLLGSLVLFIVGTLDIFKLAKMTFEYYVGRSDQDIHESIIADIILAVDIYLVAVVLLIFGTGAYRLFISPIDESEDRGVAHPFNIQTFDELKDKIVRVVILAVIIEFFRAVVDIQFSTPLDAIYLALSVLALAASVYLMNINHGKKKMEKGDSGPSSE
ncbi:YqhA family protein [Marinimicrobium alkaliphilum]|uniref:YqhA family protein n=1 Tax=Marinimicrobium alkaliphilum TaxID=2202654 RepID=UPI000DB9C170|nr:YqhA family protein [Marinimicrobium alkaliphilum]